MGEERAGEAAGAFCIFPSIISWTVFSIEKEGYPHICLR